jgi:hypothetical protein
MTIADGYHRVCASYHLDENADIPCHLVDHKVPVPAPGFRRGNGVTSAVGAGASPRPGGPVGPAGLGGGLGGGPDADSSAGSTPGVDPGAAPGPADPFGSGRRDSGSSRGLGAAGASGGF